MPKHAQISCLAALIYCVLFGTPGKAAEPLGRASGVDQSAYFGLPPGGLGSAVPVGYQAQWATAAAEEPGPMPMYGDPAAAGHVGCDCGAGGFGGYGMDPGACAGYDSGVCARNYFDVHAEFMYIRRDEISRLVAFSSDGLAGPTVLSTDDLEFDEQSGFRVTASLDYPIAFVGLAPLLANRRLEASYFGMINWSDAAQVTSATDNLYSIFSNFGQPPVFGGFLDTDQAALHRIEYSSRLDNVELNSRDGWSMPRCQVHGSWLLGIRYVRLAEELAFLTRVDAHDDPLTPLLVDPNERGPAQLDYTLATINDLLGLQLGGDIYFDVVPGLQFGAEAEAGVYGNHARQESTITATTVAGTVTESSDVTDLAFVAEGSAIMTYKISYHLTLRVGYTVFYVDGVALAPENFNATHPLVGRAATPVFNDGTALYHGGTGGLEWTW